MTPPTQEQSSEVPPAQQPEPRRAASATAFLRVLILHQEDYQGKWPVHRPTRSPIRSKTHAGPGPNRGRIGGFIIFCREDYLGGILKPCLTAQS